MAEDTRACSMNFSELFEQVSANQICVEKVVKGTIIDIDNNFVTIDVGLKSEGRVPTGEFVHGSRKMELRKDDKIDVFIDRYENKTGEIVLSREKALREAAWDALELAYREGTNVVGTIYSRVKGGFMVDLGGATAFLPSSQVDVRPVKDMAPLMETEQSFLILKIDKMRENIVVSRRGILEGENAEERAKVVANLAEGQILSGVVKNITSYGAFVDIGGIDGLLHNTDISWKRINHPSEVLATGQKIEVKVIKFNKEARRISLGMKQLTKDPWSGIADEFGVGARIKGKIINMTDYGIFVEIKEGVEGLVYVSEISWKKNTAPADVGSVGEEIEVVVLEVDVNKRRIGLSLKRLQTNPWNDIAKNFPVGHIFDGIVYEVTDFGIFIRINDDINGMVHINDISWDKFNKEDLIKFKNGEVLKVKVLEVNQEKEKISLGIKQLIKNPYGDAKSDIKKGDVVTCLVKAIVNDGIEVTLANGIVGSIKKIDLAKDKQDRRNDRFAVGEKVDAKVVSVDKANGKAVLSIKALEIEEEQQAMAVYGSSDSGASLGDILGIAIDGNGKN